MNPARRPPPGAPPDSGTSIPRPRVAGADSLCPIHSNFIIFEQGPRTPTRGTRGSVWPGQSPRAPVAVAEHRPGAPVRVSGARGLCPGHRKPPPAQTTTPLGTPIPYHTDFASAPRPSPKLDRFRDRRGPSSPPSEAPPIRRRAPPSSHGALQPGSPGLPRSGGRPGLQAGCFAPRRGGTERRPRTSGLKRPRFGSDRGAGRNREVIESAILSCCLWDGLALPRPHGPMPESAGTPLPAPDTGGRFYKVARPTPANGPIPARSRGARGPPILGARGGPAGRRGGARPDRIPAGGTRTPGPSGI